MGQVEKATHMQSKKPSVYQVGYGRPPERMRFQPGSSGNPKAAPAP